LRGVRALLARGINAEIKDSGRSTALMRGLRVGKVDLGELRELLGRTSGRLANKRHIRYEEPEDIDMEEA
jgi:hypothetical protein